LADPNLDDPLDVNVTDHFRKDPVGATKKAEEWKKLYALPETDDVDSE
jgi:ubiquitin-protein ligase